jgi:Ca2+-binding RTX toxin-like protein
MALVLINPNQNSTRVVQSVEGNRRWSSGTSTTLLTVNFAGAEIWYPTQNPTGQYAIDVVTETGRVLIKNANSVESWSTSANVSVRNATITALRKFSDYANLSINPVDPVVNPVLADISLSLFQGADASFMNLPGGANHVGALNISDVSIDIGSLAEVGGGTFGYYLILHELGHSLGLAHPFASSAGNNPIANLETENTPLNDIKYTMMAYRGTRLSYGNGVSPMALDVAALQHMYGDQLNSHLGDSRYTLLDAGTGAVADTSAAVQIGRAYYCIWDADGISASGGSAASSSAQDVIRYTGSSRVLLNLNDATLENAAPDPNMVDSLSALQASSAWGTLSADVQRGMSPAYSAGGYFSQILDNGGTAVDGGFSIANRVMIENAEAGSGDDVIIGNEGNNRLLGNNGRDAEFAGAGDDVLFGGNRAGNETDGGSLTYVEGVTWIDGVPDRLEGGAGFDQYFAGARRSGDATPATLGGRTSINPAIYDIIDTIRDTDGDGRITVAGSLNSLNANGTLYSAGDAVFTLAGNYVLRQSIPGRLDVWELNGIQLIVDRPPNGPSRIIVVGNASEIYYDVPLCIIEDFHWGDFGINGSGGGIPIRVRTPLPGTAPPANPTPGIQGSSGANIITGTTGDDIIDGGGGGDTINGGLGYDFVTYALSDAAVNVDLESVTQTGGRAAGSALSSIEGVVGSAFDDSIKGDTDNNYLIGGAGNDLLDGRAGNDVLDGGTGADSMFGGNGDDTYFVDNVADVVTEAAGAGSENVNSSLLNYTLSANVENLTLVGALNSNGSGNAANNILTGNASNNYLDGGVGDDSLYGGDGNDILLGATGTDMLYGGAGNDFLYGGTGGDTLYGGDGNDNINGNGTGDYDYTNAAYGGNGDDFMYASDAGGSMYGDAGNDNMTGGTSADNLYGGEGADFIYGGAGNDLLDGGDGSNYVYGGDGSDTLNGGATTSYLYGGNGANVMNGGTSQDYMFGGTGTNTFYGNAGNDFVLAGGQAGSADTGYGGIGDDYLFMGDGSAAAGPTF